MNSVANGSGDTLHVGVPTNSGSPDSGRRKCASATDCKQTTVGSRSRSGDRRASPKLTNEVLLPGLTSENWKLVCRGLAYHRDSTDCSISVALCRCMETEMFNSMALAQTPKTVEMRAQISLFFQAAVHLSRRKNSERPYSREAKALGGISA